AIHVHKLPLHGMTGEASFAFAEGKLLVFTWEHHKEHKEGLTTSDLKNYNALLRGLQADWGRGKVRTSPYNRAVKETTWRLKNARGSIRYDPEKIKVQMIDAAYLERARARAPK